MLTFLLEDDRHHIWVVVSNGHVEGRLQSHTKGVIRLSLLGLQVGVGPLLEQLCCQARQATATRCMKWALTLKKGKGISNIFIGKDIRTSYDLRICY